MEEITKDMKISDILALNELIAPFLMQNGLGCVSCSASSAESLEEACELHGINVEYLTEDLNDVLREYLEIQKASQQG
jgi:hydrid cluster protein-associated redox disulfide domain